MLTEKRRIAQEAVAAGTKSEGSHDRNHRLAFFSGFKHPLHQPPPDLSSLPPAASARAQRNSRVRAFISPFYIGSERMRLGFLPAVFSDTSQSLRSVSGSSRRVVFCGPHRVDSSTKLNYSQGFLHIWLFM
ncbi:uncharacterized protein LOC105427931 [Pogonomyrmex barbatus]|uniref:Uncharacterized protein LOC105427931 n=1 Tax=Pogonomyrmex barbatus TaxID=144034 RepID=A0A6I9W8S5_9HYME|nr:uncharacterized protein LOC105427931 [Pogonomyrmex barbatus]